MPPRPLCISVPQLDEIRSHSPLALLQWHPAHEALSILPEPPPRTALVCTVPALRKHGRFLFLAELGKADGALCHPHAEEGELELDFALGGGAAGVDDDRSNEEC